MSTQSLRTKIRRSLPFELPSTPLSESAFGFWFAAKRLANRLRSASEGASVTSVARALCGNRQANDADPDRRW